METAHSLAVNVSTEKRGSVCLNKCLREVGAHLEASATSPINVTTNPLENSVHFGGRKAPQATIVVQQPSVSLDHANISTILLKNGSEFVSNVESANKLSLKKQKEENMKQLLDVANNLTLEEIHDFEMRWVPVLFAAKLGVYFTKVGRQTERQTERISLDLKEFQPLICIAKTTPNRITKKFKKLLNWNIFFFYSHKILPKLYW